MSTTNLSDYYGPPYMYMNFDKDWQWGTSEHNVGGVPMIRLSKSSLDREGTIDTGLGTASNQDEQTASGEDKRIIGRAHTYSDVTVSSDSNLSEEEGENSVKLAPTTTMGDQYQFDLDSDAAQQVDENYRQIMKKKRELAPSQRTPKPNLKPCLKPLNRKLFSDMDSLCTEDLLNADQNGRHPVSQMRSGAKGAGHGSRKEKKSMKQNGQSDHDSVRTEEYEHYFHDMMVKQVAQVPITSFDQFIVDSDLDTVKSALIKNKFKKALHNSNLGDHSELSSSDTESSTPRLHDRKQDRKRTADGKHMPTAAWVLPQKGHYMQTVPQGMVLQMPYTMVGPQPSYQTHPRGKASRHANKRAGSSRMRSTPNLSLPLEDPQEDTAEEISRETARIRQELEDERRLKVRESPVSMATGSAISLSTPNLHLLNHSNYDNNSFGSTNQMALEKAQDNRMHLTHELTKLNSAVQKAKREKQGALNELKTVQEKLRQHRNDVRQMDQHIKENRAKAENARTDLMLLEFNRDSAQKDLQRTTEELERKKTALEESGFRSAEELAAMKDENEQLKVKAEQTERLQREIQELERQLENKKEAQFLEQKKLRVRVEELEEELESRDQRLEEASTDQEALQRKFNKLDVKCKAMEKSKNELIQEKTTEYEELRDRLQEQLAASKTSQTREVADLREQLKDLTAKLDLAAKEASEREETVMQLKEQLLEKDHETQQYNDKIEAIREEHAKSSDSIRANFKREIEEALTSVRIALEKDKRESLEKLEGDLEERYTCDMDQLEASLRQEVAALQGQLTGKEVEVGVLRERVRQQEEAAKTLGEVLRKDAQQQVQSAVESEKERSVGERERAIQSAISTAIPDHERTLRSFREQLGQEQDVREQQARQLTNLKKELEEARHQNRQLYMDKLSAMNQAKDQAQQEKDRQMDQLKEQIEKETMRQIDRLRETIERQEEEIGRLRAEKTDVTQRQQENLSLVERQEKMVIQEINDECSKTAELLGVTPRKVAIPSFGSSWSQTKTGTYSADGPLKNALTAALANLRASHEELRKHVTEVKLEVTNQKLALSQTMQSKSHEVEAVKAKLNAEKTSAMESLKDRLIKSHLAANCVFYEFPESNCSIVMRLKEHRRTEREWERERTNQQREMERLEREVQRRHASSSVTSGRPPVSDPTSSKTVLQLQAQVRHLQSENSSLKRVPWRMTTANSSSTPDLTSVGVRPASPSASTLLTHSSLPTSPASTYHVTGSGSMGTGSGSFGTLEERIRQAERRAQLAEGRASRNEHMLNSTMGQLNKVQGSMSQKNKELMQLERAYNQLQRQSPLR